MTKLQRDDDYEILMEVLRSRRCFELAGRETQNYGHGDGQVGINKGILSRRSFIYIQSLKKLALHDLSSIRLQSRSLLALI